MEEELDRSQPATTTDLRGNGTSAAMQLAERLKTRQATIGVVGLGYVGLPLAVEYAEQGFRTVGIDLDEDRVSQLNAGTNYIDDLDDEVVRRHVEDNRLSAASDFSRSAEVDVFFICVPTPMTEANEPDTSYIEAAIRSVGEHLRPGQLVVIKSTTYPSTTDEVVVPLLEDAARSQGLTVGEEVFVAYSPERIDPGNEEYTTGNTPVVVGGVTEVCTDIATRALGHIVADIHTVSSPKVAEMEKLLENIYRSVNIALVNELAQLAERMDDVSIWEVIEAAATKPFGFQPFYPGPGLGGHCIPVDPHYLSWLAERHDFETSFITLSARVNEEMPLHVTQSVVEAIARQPVSLGEATVLLLGVAFKANVDDTRRSPARKITQLLREKGVGTLHYHDPHVSSFTVPGADGTETTMPSVDLTPDTLQSCDVAVVVTGHDAFDSELIAEHVPAIVDTRNALEDVSDPALREKICLLGEGNHR